MKIKNLFDDKNFYKALFLIGLPIMLQNLFKLACEHGERHHDRKARNRRDRRSRTVQSGILSPEHGAVRYLLGRRRFHGAVLG